MKTITLIDPPNGWKYGFPKEFPDNIGNIPAWLTENGYPSEEVDILGPQFYYRIWTEEVTDDG